MAKKRNKKTRLKVRNHVAIAAHFASGGGSHGDRRLRRKRSRAAQKQSVLKEYQT